MLHERDWWCDGGCDWFDYDCQCLGFLVSPLELAPPTIHCITVMRNVKRFRV